MIPDADTAIEQHRLPVHMDPIAGLVAQAAIELIREDDGFDLFPESGQGTEQMGIMDGIPQVSISVQVGRFEGVRPPGTEPETARPLDPLQGVQQRIDELVRKASLMTA